MISQILSCNLIFFHIVLVALLRALDLFIYCCFFTISCIHYFFQFEILSFWNSFISLYLLAILIYCRQFFASKVLVRLHYLSFPFFLTIAGFLSLSLLNFIIFPFHVNLFACQYISGFF